MDIIAAEDTRVTAILCQKIGIKKTLLSLQKFNEKSRINTVLEALKKGQSIALVSDAGTPVISDPGAMLIQALKKRRDPYCTNTRPLCSDNIIIGCRIKR